MRSGSWTPPPSRRSPPPWSRRSRSKSCAPAAATTPKGRAPSARSARPSSPAAEATAAQLLLLRRGLDQPERVALRIDEERDPAAHREIHRRHGRGGPERLRLLQRAVDVVDARVDGLVARVRALGARADATRDAA